MPRSFIASALLFALPIVAAGQQAPHPSEGTAQGPAAPAAPESSADLMKKLSNPLAALVSVPFQFNWAQGVGPDEQTRFILNVQPVMPFSISKDWNLITRLIVPLVGQPPLVAGGAPTFGVSDIQTSFFFSPKESGLVWGAGPAMSLPSTTARTLGSEKWAAGPTLVVLKQSGPWSVGFLANQLWSFGGNESRNKINQMYLQPFLSYTSHSAVTVGLNAESTANWEADSDQWTVPINLAVSKLSSFGPFPASYQVGFGVYVAGPESGPEWQIRSSITILLPRKK